MLYHFDCNCLSSDYLVFFDGKEVISFVRIKGDFFFFKGVFKGLYDHRWSHHLVQIDRSCMTSAIYSIYRTTGLYLTASL